MMGRCDCEYGCGHPGRVNSVSTDCVGVPILKLREVGRNLEEDPRTAVVCSTCVMFYLNHTLEWELDDAGDGYWIETSVGRW